MLQSLTGKRGAPGGASHQESASLAVAGGPDEIADPLESEHRVVDVKRHHAHAVICIRRGRGDPRTHAARLIDALFENLPLLVFAIKHELIRVLRRVELANRGINANLAKHPLHAEGSCLVGNDGYDVLADVFVLDQACHHSYQCHGRRYLAIAGAFQQRAEGFERRHDQRRCGRIARRQITAQSGAPLLKVSQLFAVLGGLSERQAGNFLVGNLNIEAIADFLEILVGEFFLLMGGVQTFARLAHAEAFDGFRQNHGGRTRMRDRRSIGGIDLLRIMTAAIQVPDLFIRHIRDHFLQFRILAEEMFACIGAALGFEILVFAVHAFFHHPPEESLLIALQQRIPASAPQNLDDVPTGAQKGRFEFLNDLAIAAHRSVQPLQVAIDHEDQVVQLLAHRHGERAHGFGLVHFAVAQECPHLSIGGRDDAAMLQVAQKSRLENRHHRAQTHRHRGELPEVRHQPGMRIGGQPAAAHLLAKTLQLALVQAPFKVGAGINSGTGMPLHKDHVAGVGCAARTPKMIEPDLVQRRGGRIRRNVTAILGVGTVGLHHHRQRIPSYIGFVAPLQRAVARILRLLRFGDRVQICGVRLEGQVSAGAAGKVHQFFQQKMRAFRALRTHDRIDGLQPLQRFGRINVFERRLLRHKCTDPRVLLRWQARYSAPALTATALLPALSSGFGFSRSRRSPSDRLRGMKSRYLAVLRYVDSLAL